VAFSTNTYAANEVEFSIFVALNAVWPLRLLREREVIYGPKQKYKAIAEALSIAPRYRRVVEY
jgi:hypothetical protein